MPKLKNRETGSVVDVPNEKAERLYGMGYSPVEDAKPKTAKKATSPSKNK